MNSCHFSLLLGNMKQFYYFRMQPIFYWNTYKSNHWLSCNYQAIKVVFGLQQHFAKRLVVKCGKCLVAAIFVACHTFLVSYPIYHTLSCQPTFATSVVTQFIRHKNFGIPHLWQKNVVKCGGKPNMPFVLNVVKFNVTIISSM